MFHKRYINDVALSINCELKIRFQLAKFVVLGDCYNLGILVLTDVIKEELDNSIMSVNYCLVVHIASNNVVCIYYFMRTKRAGIV